MSHKYAFTPRHYMKMKLDRMTQPIPQNIMEIIKTELQNGNIKNITAQVIRQILLKHKLYDYIDSVQTILVQLNNPLVPVQNEECCICYEIVNNVVKLVCDHMFCQKCSNQIQHNDTIKCPLCRNKQDYVEQLEIDNLKQKKILEEFEKNKDDYKIGKNYIPFSEIIKDIYDNLDNNKK